MTDRRPPRLAFVLLERLVPDSAPLAGDLTEEFSGGRSRAWVWWQVVAAVAMAPFRATDEIRPLRLVDLQPNEAQERSRRVLLRFDPVNLTASPVHGIGGLGLLVLALLVSAVVPTVWWVLLASILGGIAFGVARFAMHRG